MNSNFSIEKRMYNSSSISDYQGCPKMFYFVWVRRLSPKGINAPLLFGSAFHEVLRLWYKTNSVDEAMKGFDMLPENMVDEYRNKSWGIAIFKQYVQRYASEIGETLYLEEQFIIEIGERLYAGRLDRIEKWRDSIYVDDHKTTKQLGINFFDSFRPNTQIDGYCYACREIMGKCHGAIINGISVAKNPKERFMRFPSSRTNDEMDRFEEVFTLWTDDMERDMKCGKFRRNTNYCTRWGKCKFWALCVYGEDERLIEQNYDVEPEEKEDKSESDGTDKKVVADRN